MTTTAAKPASARTDVPPIPPAKYWRLSPTFEHWTKLSAWDIIQTLHQPPAFSGQDVLFFLNHPIRYIYLTALVVAVETPTDRVTLLVLDDGSGACIEAVVRGAPAEGGVASIIDTAPRMTLVDGVSRTARGDVFLEGKALGPGSAVKVKGTIGQFRGARQVDVKRMGRLAGTREEVGGWRARAELRREVLEVPWTVGEEERERIDEEIRAEEEEERRRVVRDEMKSGERGKRREEKERRREIRRQREEAKMNTGALI